ncbi:glycosyltransferase family 87 protein [Roseibium sp. HPY-6]|uniref:glycosyltransferase family 87 protein n=1 Tax=Roseibium sp. HPY-6 TaxID=3229852 RepID=UPI00338EFEA3
MSSARSLLPFWNSKTVRNTLGGPAFLWLMIISALGTLQGLWTVRSAVFEFPQTLKDARVEDLSAFHRASEMANSGSAANVYDPALFREGLSDRLSDLIFLNPPHALPLFHVFSWTDFATLKIIILGMTLIALFAIPRLAGFNLAVSALFAASVGTVQILLRLNLSIFIITLIVFALVHAKQRPILAGLSLAVATIKPQYGLLVPFFLIGIGAWRCIGWATLGTLLLAGLSFVLYGPGVFVSYTSSFTTPLYQAYALTALEWDTSLRSFLGRMNVDMGLRAALVFTAIILGAICALRLPAGLPCELRIGLVLLLSAVVAPSFLYYSWPLFAAGVLFVARALPDWPMELQFLTCLTWMQPFVYLLLLSIWPSTLGTHATSVFLLVTAVPAGFYLLIRYRQPRKALASLSTPETVRSGA